MKIRQPVIMGIVNVTPDSFSDGGLHLQVDAAVRQAKRLVAEGADIIDIGGESTRPGAAAVDAATQAARVFPVFEALQAAGLGARLSIDTSDPRVALGALQRGASIVNDVRALRSPRLRDVVAQHQATAILMHMRGEPASMQAAADYHDVVACVAHELQQARDRALASQIAREHIWLDPGLGFAKLAQHNLSLIKHLPRLVALGHPVVLGASRKAFLTKLIGEEDQAARDQATATVCALATLHGVQVLRVHDVTSARRALRVASAVGNAA